MPEAPWRARVAAIADASGRMAVRIPQPEAPRVPLEVRDDAGRKLLWHNLSTAPYRQLDLLVMLPDGLPQAKAVCIYLAEENAEEYGLDAIPLTRPGNPAGTTVMDAAIVPVGGGGLPNSFARMRFIFERATRSRQSIPLVIEPDLTVSRPEPPESDERRRRGPSMWVARQSATLWCEHAGYYRFAVKNAPIAGVRVNGIHAGEWIEHHGVEEWSGGTPVRLEAGVNFVEIFAGFNESPAFEIGWLPPGKTDFAPFEPMALICPSAPVTALVEERSAAVAIDFAIRLEDSYRFDISPQVFIPADLHSRSRARTRQLGKQVWQLPDGRIHEGARWLGILRQEEAMPVTLTVQDYTGLSDSINYNIVAQNEFPHLYRLAAHLEYLPAFCAPDAVLYPAIWISGNVPPRIPVEAEWTLHFNDGSIRQGSVTAERLAETARIHLPALDVQTVASMEWRITHAGYYLIGEELLIRRPPYGTVPHEVKGDAWYNADGQRLVLVAAFEDRLPPARHTATAGSGSNLLWWDDLPHRPGSDPQMRRNRLLAKTGNRRIEYINWSAERGSGHNAWLLRMLHILQSAESAAGTMLLSLGHQDILRSRPPRIFEQELAVLVDLLREHAPHLQLRLITPVPAPNGPDARQYVAIVQQNAVTRQLTCADPFSVLNAEKQQLYFSTDDFFPLPRGEHRRIEVIARRLQDPL